MVVVTAVHYEYFHWHVYDNISKVFNINEDRKFRMAIKTLLNLQFAQEQTRTCIVFYYIIILHMSIPCRKRAIALLRRLVRPGITSLFVHHLFVIRNVNYWHPDILSLDS